MKIFTALLTAASLMAAPVTVGATAVDAGGISVYDADDRLLFCRDAQRQVSSDAAVYHADTNTLTLHAAQWADATLLLRDMGDDFCISVEGDCALGGIVIDDGSVGTSVRLTGTGALTVNERQHGLAAVTSHGGGENKRFCIDKSVSATLYGTDGLVFSAYLNHPDANTVFTADGVAADGVVLEEDVYQCAEALRVAYVSDAGKAVTHGTRVHALADTEGVYAAETASDDPDTVYVTRYVYVDALGAYAVDPTFRDNAGADGKKLTRAAFEAQYQTVTEPQPAPVYYTASWNDRESRGESGVQLFRAADPAGVYVGVKAGDTADYTVYRLLWDADSGIYRTDVSFSRVELTGETLAQNGYIILSSEEQDNVYYTCWRYPVGAAGNERCDFPRLQRRGHPDDIYVETGTFDDGRQSGANIAQVRFDEKTGEAYLAGLADFQVPDEEFERPDADFSYMLRTTVEETRLRFYDENASFEDYALRGDRWERDGEVFAMTSYEQDGVTRHDLVPLTYLADEGYFYADTEITDVNPEVLRAEGYTPVYAGAPAAFITQGTVEMSEWPVYRDDDGHSWLRGWDDAMYTYSADKTVSVGGVACYLPARDDRVNAAALHDTEQTVHTGWYACTLRQAVYRHEGSCPLRGDVNSDGRVDINDATLLQKYLTEMETLTDCQLSAADTNGDGTVSIDDVTVIQKIIAEIAI
ncbi:MAG: dockerin type I repeat-containing protein [Ruminococcus sp.]|nr:dockerin type I repeat-containing protein [Ruminococcus sp.]